MKISAILNTLVILILTSTARGQEELPCKEPKRVGCPEVVCNLMNSRKTDFCKEIQCEGLTTDDCLNINTVYERELSMCGCCAGCAKYLGEGEPCEVSPPPASKDPHCKEEICPILKNRCKPGLVCNYLGETAKVCAVPEDPGAGEQQNTESCEYKKTLKSVNQLHWQPNCELDGTYSPKQCKGSIHDGVCFCVNAKGERIFGREWWNKAENQTCDCSRQVYTLREEGNIATIHCSADGNYEPLQCDTDSGICYCVDPITGKLNGAVLPEHQWKQLPCYSVNLTDWDSTGQYLRICESEWAAGQRINKEAALHGLEVYSSKDLTCDFDGSYAPIQRVGQQWFCVTPVRELGPHHLIIETLPMNCQCFRDSLLYIAESRPFLKSCDLGTGNYDETALFNDVDNTYSCIDKDGFYFGDVVEERFKCCLLESCSGQADTIKNECYDPVTKTGKYHSCSFWPT